MEVFFFKGVPPPFFSKVWLDTASRFLVTVIIFRLLDTKSVNCHRDRGRHGRHPGNCRRFRLSDDVLNSKMSTVTGIAEGRVAILVTVDVFGLSHFLGDSKVSTVTGISCVRVAILVTVDAFELSDQFRS